MKMEENKTHFQGQLIDGVFVVRDNDQPTTWWFIPPFPLPETDPVGRPMINLWVTGESAILQLGVQWTVSPSTLDRIRQKLRGVYSLGDLEEINLVPAPVTMEGASVVLMNESEPEVVLGNSATSGLAPWSAVFSITVIGSQIPLVMAALENNDQRTVVQYRGKFTHWLPVVASITGNARQDVAALPSNCTVERAGKQLDQALAAGRLNFLLESPDFLECSSNQALNTEVRALATNLLVSMAREKGSRIPQDAAHLTATAHQQTEESVPFISSIPLGHWFPDGRGEKHVTVIG